MRSVSRVQTPTELLARQEGRPKLRTVALWRPVSYAALPAIVVTRSEGSDERPFPYCACLASVAGVLRRRHAGTSSRPDTLPNSIAAASDARQRVSTPVAASSEGGQERTTGQALHSRELEIATIPSRYPRRRSASVRSDRRPSWRRCARRRPSTPAWRTIGLPSSHPSNSRSVTGPAGRFDSISGDARNAPAQRWSVF